MKKNACNILYSRTVSYSTSIRNISDYSPFGVQLVGRTVSGDSYRYGFQGQEKDGEVSGEGNSYDFGERMYNPRIGRFFNIDPESRSFESPYAFAANNPVAYIDVDGAWPCWSCWAKKALTIVSTALDFVPGVGQVKGWVEGAVGYSMDGSKLEPWERALAFVPGGRIFTKVGKFAAAAIVVVNANKVINKVKKVTNKIHIRVKLSTTENITKVDVNKRAKEIHDALPDATKSRTTTAVATTTDGNVLIGSSEKRLRKSQRDVLKEGEIEVIGNGHAEETILKHAENTGTKIEEIGTSRPICSDCDDLIKESGATSSSPRSGKPSKHRIKNGTGRYKF